MRTKVCSLFFQLAPEGPERHDRFMTRAGQPPKHLALGHAGEEAAARFLAAKGIRLLARNWRPEGGGHGLELDIVAEQQGTLLFVEVKTRNAPCGAQNAQHSDFGPEANFTPAKRKKFIQAARLFLSQAGVWNKPCRFDLVCVTVFPQGPPKLEHHSHVIELGTAVGGGNTAWQPW